MVEEVISFSFSFSEILTLTVNFRVGAGTIDSVVFFCFATHSLTLSRSLSLSLSLALALRFSLSLASVFFFSVTRLCRYTEVILMRGYLYSSSRCPLSPRPTATSRTPPASIVFPISDHRSFLDLASRSEERRIKREKRSRGRISPRTGRNRATFHEKDAHTSSTYNS